MWVEVRNEPIPTYGNDGKRFMLCLKYRHYYGHRITKKQEVIYAIWDSIHEYFYEEKTLKEIDNRDIWGWLKNEDKTNDKENSC